MSDQERMDVAPRPPDRGALGRAPSALVPAVPFLWLAFFFLVPFAIVFKIALSEPATAQPPYRPVFDLSQGFEGLREAFSQLSFYNFTLLLEDSLYFSSFISSLRIAAVSTVLLLAIGFPIAYAMAKAPERWRPTLLMLVILPFWTSFLIRVYAWIGILKPEGLLSALLINLGLISEPLQIMNTDTAVFIGIVYSYLPFMVLPLYATLEKFDYTLLEAAEDLGCPPWRAFWRITVPLAMPGVLAGCLLCFIPVVGEFVIPDLLGGSETLMIGRTLWSEFFSNRDWPLASAVAVVLLVLLVGPIVAYRDIEARRWEKAQ
ncbi:putrescine transport system permease protein [Chelatococcus composti]|uniref:Putrescine transport system permease protein n=2 Tax=Chelatococcus composti TaxID=1743235 RepID=A0A841K5T6_9HYPH|nr:putrescine transport system permease protein [Chelatococcus composti]